MLYLLLLALPEALVKVIDVGTTLAMSLAPYAEKTVFLVPQFVHDMNVKTPYKFLSCIFLCYPLGLIVYLLPYGNKRHIFNVVVGMAMQQFLIGSLWLNIALPSMITYLLFILLPKRYVKWVVPLYLYSQLSVSHLYSFYKDFYGGGLLCIPFQMTFTQKITQLAYNIFDGYILQQMQDGSKTVSKREEQVATKCQDWAVSDVPNLLEYLGYVFCFSTFMFGPVYEFSTYNNAINGNFVRRNNNNNKHRETSLARKRKLPSNILPTLVPLIQGMTLLWLHRKISSHYHWQKLADPSVVNLPYFWRFVYLNMACIPVRTLFYSQWKLAEGANNLWYAGFDGFDEYTGKPLGWTNAKNVDIMKLEIVPYLELSADFRNLSKTWNMKTSNYLKRYMYYRSNGSLVYTYFMSALWHGFYPCLYLVGASVVLFTCCERLGRKRIDHYIANTPRKSWRRRIANILCFLPYYYVLQYFIMFGDLRSWEKVYTFWKSHYFYGHIAMLLFFVVILVFPAQPKAASTTTKKERTGRYENHNNTSMEEKCPSSPVTVTCFPISEEEYNA